MPAVMWGVVLVAGAVGMLAYAMYADPVPRVSKRRRLGETTPREPLLPRVYRGFVGGVDSILRSRGWVPFRAAELEDADVNRPLGTIVSWIVMAMVLAFGAGLVFSGPAGGVLLALVVPVAAKLTLRVRANRRRATFGKQLDNTLRIVAAALRAGQSLSMALASVASDSEAPMSEEITRIINENRLGRDLVESMEDVATRMRNEDFQWFAEAVAVQRDAGGSLNDIIDTVAETIRDRAEIREKIRANAAEGKASAYVLMGLPIALGVAYSLMSPGYMDPLLSTTIGRLLLGVSVLLYGLSYVWMKSIIAIKV